MRYRRGYLRCLDSTERLLARHRIFTLLDFHHRVLELRRRAGTARFGLTVNPDG